MKTIPANDFAVVWDRERNMIVSTGSYSQCINDAEVYNRLYQSTAYVAQLWETR